MNTWTRIRVTSIYLAFIAFIGIVGFRLAKLQILSNPELQNLARKQFERSTKTNLSRRSILDRNGEELAVTLNAGSVFARPKLIRNKRETARKLSEVMGGPASKWLAKLKTQKPFVWMQRQVTHEVAQKIEKAKISGVFVEPENKRIYPNDSLAANTIGFTDIDGNGLGGLELGLDETLKKDPPRATILKDGKGNLSYIDRKVLRPEEERDGVRVTIDRQVQDALEEELDKSLLETGAKSAMGIVMDPSTGEIFAIGQRPSFDANHLPGTSSHALANRMISHLFEPGSTIKVITAAQAIEDKILKPDSPLDCGKGEITIGNRKIREAEADHRYSILPLEGVIQHSSNVGAVRVAQALGANGMRKTLDNFGLTQKTGIKLPGETTGSAKGPEAWNPFFLATAGFGQGIAVTPLQMVAAYAPFANGGYRIRPKILMSEVSPEALKNETKTKVISSATAEAMRKMLVGVTEPGGTGVSASIAGLHVAGKTGTAQKYKMGEGYEGGNYYNSFIGFLPAEAPQLLIGVMVDEPANKHYASQTAAPLFKKVAERSLVLLDRVPRQMVAESDRVTPVKTSRPLVKPRIELVFDGNKWLMPNLMGTSVRESLELVAPFFQNLRVTGSGYVTSQLPTPGSPVTPQTPVVLEFSTPSAG